MVKIAELIDRALMNHDQETVINEIKQEVNTWMKQFPLY
jgi:glycine hydroxymethyltransferase